MSAPTGYVRVASVDEIQARGCVVAAVDGHSLALFYHDGQVSAVDNRCPHMGFPLSRGTIRDGLLTCHWHHARFDLRGGGTLDPFADDARAFPTAVVEGEVWVDPRPLGGDRVAYWRKRLEDGLEQQLSLVLAKSVLALLAAGVAPREIVCQAARYGVRYRAAGWGPGMTILTATAQVLPALAPEDRPLALYHGLVHLAADCAGRPPRFALEPLPGSTVELSRLKGWFCRAVEVRNSDGAERVLATAIASGAPPAALADMLLAAATDHYYLDAGHTLDFINKACELLDLIGWEESGQVLPSLVRGLCQAGRAEEGDAWRHPVDLVELLTPVFADLPALFAARGGAAGGNALGDRFDPLVATLLGENPAAIVAALVGALRDGVALAELGQVVAHAAALRIARFPTSNEYGDWDTVHNTYTAGNALHQALKRAPSPELARGLFHGALRVYLDRFLNVPAARLPAGAANGATPDQLRERLLDLLDREQQVAGAGQMVHEYLAAGYPDDGLLCTLGHALLREDADFHGYQAYEAGWRQYHDLEQERPEAAARTLIGLARFLAAHAPTPRAMRQTAQIALRLQRGEALHEAAEGEAESEFGAGS